MALTLQTSTGYLDLYADESISIDYNLADLRDPAVVFSPISKSFSVPATDVNNQFFKHYYDVSISGGFNPYAKQDVTLYSDDLVMLNGYYQRELRDQRRNHREQHLDIQRSNRITNQDLQQLRKG